jgi:CRISPR/Cas system CSM-associated protein Csm3 (group 7 of RAMP superfamily)
MATAHTYKLTFDLQSFWHISNGHEAGAYADVLTLKDKKGLPYIPGKSIKGLLRTAFTEAIGNHWFSEQSDDFLMLLFGDEALTGDHAQGILQLSSAQLPASETNFFDLHINAKTHLYQVLKSTAIDHDSGVAKNGSLRSIEVCIPLKLESFIEVNTLHPGFKAFKAKNLNIETKLKQVLPLITAVGAKRKRGLGKVFVTCEAAQ